MKRFIRQSRYALGVTATCTDFRLIGCASKWRDIGARAGARAQRYLSRPPFAPWRALKGEGQSTDRPTLPHGAILLGRLRTVRRERRYL